MKLLVVLHNLIWRKKWLQVPEDLVIELVELDTDMMPYRYQIKFRNTRWLLYKEELIGYMVEKNTRIIKTVNGVKGIGLTGNKGNFDLYIFNEDRAIRCVRM